MNILMHEDLDYLVQAAEKVQQYEINVHPRMHAALVQIAKADS